MRSALQLSSLQKQCKKLKVCSTKIYKFFNTLQDAASTPLFVQVICAVSVVILSIYTNKYKHIKFTAELTIRERYTYSGTADIQLPNEIIDQHQTPVNIVKTLLRCTHYFVDSNTKVKNINNSLTGASLKII